MDDRRQASRNMCADFITINWTDEAGESRSDVAILDDISESGVCIGLDCAIPVETKVYLDHPKGRYEGKIKYCRYFEIGYFLGVSFDDGHRWSREDFEPAYLLEMPVAEDSAPERQARRRRHRQPKRTNGH
jgi:hypothetical protein